MFALTKEWAELPPASDLYKLTNPTIKIADSINIEDLEFKRLDGIFITDELLQDQSKIRFSE